MHLQRRNIQANASFQREGAWWPQQLEWRGDRICFPSPHRICQLNWKCCTLCKFFLSFYKMFSLCALLTLCTTFENRPVSLSDAAHITISHTPLTSCPHIQNHSHFFLLLCSLIACFCFTLELLCLSFPGQHHSNAVHWSSPPCPFPPVFSPESTTGRSFWLPHLRKLHVYINSLRNACYSNWQSLHRRVDTYIFARLSFPPRNYCRPRNRSEKPLHFTKIHISRVCSLLSKYSCQSRVDISLSPSSMESLGVFSPVPDFVVTIFFKISMF